MARANYSLKRISKCTAHNFYKNYEHLGNCGLGVWHYGLYNDDKLISVVSYGTANYNTNRSNLSIVAKMHNLKTIQLTRGGTMFDAPKNIPSMIIKMSLKCLRKEFGDSIIIAYSDTYWNEIGTIYQASNFLYLGHTNPKGQSNYIINGHKMTGWTVRKKYGTRDIAYLKTVAASVIRIPLTPKHKYLYINSSRTVKKYITKEISPTIKGYPKRSDYNVGSMNEIRKILIV